MAIGTSVSGTGTKLALLRSKVGLEERTRLGEFLSNVGDSLRDTIDQRLGSRLSVGRLEVVKKSVSM